MDILDLLEAEFTWHPNHMPHDPFGSLVELAMGYNYLALQAISHQSGRYTWSPSDFLSALANDDSETGFLARSSCLMLYASKQGSRAEVLEKLVAIVHEFARFKGSETFMTRSRIICAILGLTVLRTEPKGSGEVDQAARANSQMLAAAAFLDADLPDESARCFDALDWRLAIPNPEIDNFTIRLAHVSSTLERRIGPIFCQRALHYWHQLLSQPECSGYTMLAFEAAKGVLFASRLRNGGGRMVTALPAWQDTLSKLRKVPREVLAHLDEKFEWEGSEMLLFSSTGGASYRHHVLNRSEDLLLELRIQLDTLVLGAHWYAEIPHLSFLGVRKIQDYLQPNTVLMSLLDLPAESTTGRNTTFGLKVLIVGKSSHRLLAIESGGAHFLTGLGDQTYDRFASLVAAWRQHFLRELDRDSDLAISGVWPADVSKAADEEEAALFAGSQLFPPGLAEYLDLLKEQGADHLLINPHGSLHFCPFHLLADDKGRVADRWTVTYLPVIGQLRPSDEDDKSLATRSGAGVFGVSSGPNATEEERLPEAAREAQAIASALGTTAFVDSEATRDAFLHSLRTAQYVHVATHGDHCPYAPAFQRIFLSNDSRTEAVYAYEILETDLRGLEVISFSACETALGRYDEGDNLRGLAASCFLAGAQTVLGTMWPVYDDVASLFFVEFYRELTAGRSKVDAFRRAQLRTRNAFPSVVDWGSFILIGYPY
jgi:hypothetical protein